MKVGLVIVVFLAIQLVSFLAKAEAQIKYQFGRDEMCFSGSARTNIWRSIESKSLRSIMGGDLNIDTGKLPLREGFTLYRERSRVLYVESEKKRCRVSWQDIGEYINEIRDAEQMLSLLTVLHNDFQSTRIGLIGFSNILHSVATPTNELPFVVRHGQVEEDTIQKGVFEQEGVWLAHFLCVESASVVEYKYAVSRSNCLARIRRVVLEGPDNPSNEGDLPYLSWSAEKKARYEILTKCWEYLMSQTMCPIVDHKAGRKQNKKQ